VKSLQVVANLALADGELQGVLDRWLPFPAPPHAACLAGSTGRPARKRPAVEPCLAGGLGCQERALVVDALHSGVR